MKDTKWKTKPLSLSEVFAAHDKGLDMVAAETLRQQFNKYSDFVTYLGNLPDAGKDKTMFFFFDTETTGLPKNWKSPVTDLDNWPRIVQLAWLAYDAAGQQVGGKTAIIKPEGFEIPEKASAIHGITTAKAVSIGESLNLHLNLVHNQISQAEHVVAHNLAFDEKVLGAEFLRAGLPKITPPKKKICTMLGSMDYCALPRNKWPKLSELHNKLFGADFAGAHDAGADIAATAKCFFELRRLGVIKI